MAAANNLPKPDSDATCYYESARDFEFRWERHSEFSTYTVISKQKILASNHYNGILALDKKWLDGIEGEVISANHIDLRSPATAPQTDAEFNESFDNNPLVVITYMMAMQLFGLL